MPIELVPLCVARVRLSPPMLLPGTQVGNRLIAEVAGLEVEGARLRAHGTGVAAADWMVVSSDGTLGTADVRMTWETDDHALIYVHYNGRLDFAQSPPVAYVAPLFDTGDERYAWICRIQAVAKGTLSPDMSVLTYEMFELR